MQQGNGNPEDDLTVTPPPSPAAQSSRFNLGNDIKKMIAVSLITAIVVFVGFGMFGGGAFVTKKDFAANMEGITATVDKAKSDMEKITNDANAAVAKANADIAAAVQSVPATVSTQVSTQINTFVSQTNSQLSALSSKVSTLEQTVSQMVTSLGNTNSAVEDLQAQVTELEQRIIELETPPSNGTSSAPFTVESRIISKSMSYDAATGNTTISFGVKLVLTNEQSRDLEDIELEVPMEVHAYVITGTGEILIWHDQASKWYLTDMDREYSIGEGAGYAVLTGTDMTLDGNDVDKITVPMTMLVRGNVTDFDVEIDDDDIDVADWGYE